MTRHFFVTHQILLQLNSCKYEKLSLILSILNAKFDQCIILNPKKVPRLNSDSINIGPSGNDWFDKISNVILPKNYAVHWRGWFLFADCNPVESWFIASMSLRKPDSMSPSDTRNMICDVSFRRIAI